MTDTYPIGPIMLDIEGVSLTPLDKEKINHPNTGAVILFSRNYENPEQIAALIESIRSSRNGDILIAVDQEGGRVQRFRRGFTRLPPASFYAKTPELAEYAGWLMSSELLAVGVDFSFAPVLDVDCGISEVIGDRSFANEPELAAQLAGSFMHGMHAAGMAAVGKHFPGHGAVTLDSHLSLPRDNRDLDAIRIKDLKPFKQLIAEGLEGIMPAHVVYSEVDPNPAGFSSFWIEQILRKELNFNGAVFSDDLSMEGAAFAGDFPDRAKMAQLAGCDMLLVCNQPADAERVLEALPVTKDAAREKRLNAMKGKPRFKWEELMKNTQWQRQSALIIQTIEKYA